MVNLKKRRRQGAPSQQVVDECTVESESVAANNARKPNIFDDDYDYDALMDEYEDKAR